MCKHYIIIYEVHNFYFNSELIFELANNAFRFSLVFPHLKTSLKILIKPFKSTKIRFNLFKSIHDNHSRFLKNGHGWSPTHEVCLKLLLFDVIISKCMQL